MKEKAKQYLTAVKFTSPHFGGNYSLAEYLL